MVLERHRTIDEIFPELYDIGPVSQTMCSPLYRYIHDTFIEAVSRGLVGKINDPMATTVQCPA